MTDLSPSQRPWTPGLLGKLIKSDVSVPCREQSPCPPPPPPLSSTSLPVRWADGWPKDTHIPVPGTCDLVTKEDGGSPEAGKGKETTFPRASGRKAGMFLVAETVWISDLQNC